MQVVVEGYVVAAALQYFGMCNIEETPGVVLTLKACSNIQRQAAFQSGMVNILKDLVNLPIRPDSTPGRAPKDSTEDSVFNYTQELMTMGLLCMEFEDAIREGDGVRVLRVWKFLLLIFKAAKRKNYSIEALTVLVQYYALLSPRQREQLLFSRFINTSGKEGANKASDLHMEHLNRTVKTAIGNQSSNLTPKVLTRIGKCAGPLFNVCKQFDSISEVVSQSGTQTRPSHENDLRKIVQELVNLQAVRKVPGRKHETIKPIRGSIVSRMNADKFTKWIKKKLSDMNISNM